MMVCGANSGQNCDSRDWVIDNTGATVEVACDTATAVVAFGGAAAGNAVPANSRIDNTIATIGDGELAALPQGTLMGATSPAGTTVTTTTFVAGAVGSVSMNAGMLLDVWSIDQNMTVLNQQVGL
jgi:hypothetical protein